MLIAAIACLQYHSTRPVSAKPSSLAACLPLHDTSGCLKFWPQFYWLGLETEIFLPRDAKLCFAMPCKVGLQFHFFALWAFRRRCDMCFVIYLTELLRNSRENINALYRLELQVRHSFAFTARSYLSLFTQNRKCYDKENFFPLWFKCPDKKWSGVPPNNTCANYVSTVFMTLHITSRWAWDILNMFCW